MTTQPYKTYKSLRFVLRMENINDAQIFSHSFHLPIVVHYKSHESYLNHDEPIHYNYYSAKRYAREYVVQKLYDMDENSHWRKLDIKKWLFRKWQSYGWLKWKSTLGDRSTLRPYHTVYTIYLEKE